MEHYTTQLHLAILGILITLLGAFISFIIKFAKLEQKLETLYDWWETTWKPTNKEENNKTRHGR